MQIFYYDSDLREPHILARKMQFCRKEAMADAKD